MKVQLYSGGMDSWLISHLWKPDLKIYIDIHGDYSEAEKKRLPEDVKIIDMPLLGEFELPNKFVPLRNLYFIMIASHYGDEICLGATAGDGSKDKNLDFLNYMEDLLNFFWNDKKVHKTLKVEKRFAKMSKGEILREYLKMGGSIEDVRRESFSCYTPIDDKECFDCYPCFRKFAMLLANGCEYSDEEMAKMWDFVQRKIIPTKEEGGYEGTYYTDRGEESKDLIKAVKMLKEKYA